MIRSMRLMALASLLLLTIGVPAEPPAGQHPPRADQLGDPVPIGALARMGSERFRHGSMVSALEFSKDGKTLASSSYDKTARLWEVATGKELRRLVGHETGVADVVFSADGRLLMSSSRRSLFFWDLANDQKRPALKEAQDMTNPIASADGKMAAWAVGGARVFICLWDLQAGKELHRVAAHEKGTESLVFSPDGRILASGGIEGTARLWDVAGGKETQKLTGHIQAVGHLAFSPDGKTIVTASTDGTVRLWEVASGKNLQTIQAQLGWGRSLTFSPDGKVLALGETNGTIRLWDLAAAKELRRWQGRREMTAAIAFSPDGKTLAAGSLQGFISFWDVTSGKQSRALTGHEDPLTLVDYAPDGRTLMTASMDNTVRFWDSASGKELRRINEFSQPGPACRCVAFSPDGKWIAAKGKDGDLRLWQVETGKNASKFPKQGVKEQAEALAFAPDSKTLVAGHRDSTVRLWDVASGQEIRRFRGLRKAAQSVAFSADGKTVTGKADDRTIWVWDTASGSVLQQLDAGAIGNHSLAFSLDGRTLFALSQLDSMLHIWELSSGQKRASLRVDRQQAFCFAFAAGSQVLLSGGADQAIHFWDVTTGKEFAALETSGGIRSLAVSADGKTCASGSVNGTAMTWDLTSVLVNRPPRVLARLGDKELEAVWTDMTGADASKAFRAMKSLWASPEQAVALLEKRVQPPPSAKRIAELITEVGSETFAVRQKASEELAKLGRAAEPALRKTLEGQPTADLRQRVTQLLEQLPKTGDNPASRADDRIVTRRALEVLEQMGTPAARQLLEKWAKGTPGYWLTEEAGACMQRLELRKEGR
jgi:WD40 repeat protein